MANKRIGLIGLGLMGSEIAQRLINQGWQVLGWDIDATRRKAAEGVGALVLSADAVWECDIVLLSLPTEQIVEGVLSSACLRPGQTVIDTTTGSPEAAERSAKRCHQKSVEFIDATISGNSQQLRDGSAAMLVGATEKGWAACGDLLKSLAADCFRVGPPGAGARMKLITNLVLGLNRAALAEGLAFAKCQGLDLQMVLKLLRATPAYSRIMDTKGEKMVQEDFTPQARLSQHLKDVRLMLQCAAQHELTMPLTEAHRQLLERAEELGLGPMDNSALVKAYGN